MQKRERFLEKERLSSVVQVFASNTFIRQTVESAMAVQYWFYFLTLSLPFSLGVFGFLVYYGSKHAGLLFIRRKLKSHLVHPRHQSVNRIERGNTRVVMINHEDKNDEGAKEEVKQALN